MALKIRIVGRRQNKKKTLKLIKKYLMLMKLLNYKNFIDFSTPVIRLSFFYSQIYMTLFNLRKVILMRLPNKNYMNCQNNRKIQKTHLIQSLKLLGMDWKLVCIQFLQKFGILMLKNKIAAVFQLSSKVTKKDLIFLMLKLVIIKLNMLPSSFQVHTCIRKIFSLVKILTQYFHINLIFT